MFPYSCTTLLQRLDKQLMDHNLWCLLKATLHSRKKSCVTLHMALE